MLFTTHSIVGAAVGVATGNPALGFAIGFLSHHVLDSIPHFDQGSFYISRQRAPYLGKFAESERDGFNGRDWVMLIIDMFLAITAFSLILFLNPQKSWLLILAGALGGLMPDIIGSSPLWPKKMAEKIKLAGVYRKFHSFFHWTVVSRKFYWGLVTQAILIAGSILFLIK